MSSCVSLLSHKQPLRERWTAAKSHCSPTCYKLINIDNYLYTRLRDADKCSAGAEVESAGFLQHDDAFNWDFTASKVANQSKRLLCLWEKLKLS